MNEFKGLFKDTSYLKTPKGMWKDAKGILMTKQFNSPVNENGTKFSHLINGEICGIIETNFEIVYFSKLNATAETDPFNSIISIYNYNTGIVTEALKGNFNFNRPIEGIYKHDYEGNLIVVWADGVFEDSNTPKIAKITNVDLPLYNGILENDKLELINLFPDITQGTIEAFTGEGNIEGIIALVTFKYGREKEETTFKPINTYAHLEEISENSTIVNNTGLRVELKDLNYLLYDYIKIGLHIIKEDAEESYISRRISIDSSNKEISINSIIDYDSISSEELLIPKGFFNKIESLSYHKDSILGLNVSRPEIFKFQKYANLLNIVPRMAGQSTDIIPTVDITFDGTERHLMFNEVYSFNIQLDLKNGITTDWFHIPNLDYDDEEFDPMIGSFYDALYNLELNRYSVSDNTPQFHISNQGTENKFGLWANKETYPDNEEYNSSIDYDGNPLAGQDLRGKRITFHRVMDEPRQNTGKPIKQSRVTIGAMITNFNVIPISVRKQIRSVRIGIVKRNFGNSLIIGEGVITPSSPQEDITAVNSGTSEGTEHLINVSPIIKSSSYRSANKPGIPHNHFLFLSPELEAIKPSLNFNTLYFKRLMVGSDYSQDVQFPLIKSESSNVDDILSNTAPNDISFKYIANRYYNKPFSYNYKLPNNPSQGSKFTDGGLYINNERSIDNFLEEDDDYLPLRTSNSALGDSLKMITLDKADIPGRSFYLVASIINLMSFKDNLYTLQEQNIISSKNTITLENDEIPLYFLKQTAFKVGDVSYAKIKGSLNFTLVQGGFGTAYTSCRFNVKIASAFSSTVLSIQDSLETKGLLLMPDNVEEHLLKLESKVYGYEVTGNTKNSTTNSYADFPTLDIFKTYLKDFPYRVIRSSLTPNEGNIINSFRNYQINNYIELDKGKGDGVAIRANDNEIYIQMRFMLLHVKVKDVLKSENTDISLQARDIFETQPVAVTPKPEGYIGSEHKFACKMTKIGYITVDHKQGTIIIANPKVTIISNNGMRNEFLNNLTFEDTYTEIVNNTVKTIDNPYANIGFSIGIDEAYNRLYICKLYPPVVDKSINREEYFSELFNMQNIPNEVPTFKDYKKSFTYSIALDFQFFVSKHPFITPMFIGVKQDLYALKNHPMTSESDLQGVVHRMNIGKKGLYFGVKEESYIDLIFNTNPNQSKSLYALELITESFIRRHNNLEDTNKTIDKLIVFTDNQCSGIVELDLSDKDKIRYVEGSFRVNNFRDLLRSPDLPILDEGGELIDANLNYNKKWFDKSYFISKFIVVRLIWNNDVQDDIYINEVNITSKISKR